MKSNFLRLFTILIVATMLVTPVSARSSLTPTSPAANTSGNPASPLAKIAPHTLRVVPDKFSTKSVPSSGNEKLNNTSPANYIIQFQAEPLARYRGGVSGLSATSPIVTGARKLDVKSPASQAYLNYLATQQAQAIASIEQAIGHSLDVIFRYKNALNGVAAKLTPQEAAAVAKLPGVLRVDPEVVQKVDTDAGPTWIGAPTIWDGSATGGLPGTMGEGIIVGDLDTGINHDHPSFAAVGGDGYVTQDPWGAGVYVGVCDPANPDYDSTWPCNDKLIGGWDFVYNVTPPGAFDYPSPEDENGHGSHTASTAAGNVVTATLIAPTVSYTKTISGVAPHANIVAYDVCYTDAAGNGLCPNTSSIAATDQAIADGVDVINFSIGGGTDPYNDDVELGFLSAVEAGIFVSTSAGNSGPGPGTTGHQSPWVSASAAATHNRLFYNSLVNMTGGDTTPPADITGKGFTSGYGPASIVWAGDYGNPLCPIGAFPADTFSGQIVVCDRGGGIARVDKAQSVADGGAGGFILANDAANGDSLVGDAYVIPGVHITYNDGVALETWLASGSGHMATIAGFAENDDPSNGDILASFSSRGPNTALDVLNPKLTAPGVDIWAAVDTPDPANPGPPEYGLLSGTSMASPHTAGSAALLMALHPSWTPPEILSALMTTADETVLKEDATTPAGFFDMGAGRDALNYAGLAGFVMDEVGVNFENADPAAGGDPRTLNIASMTDSQCLGTCSWVRTLTSVMTSTAMYTATVSGDTGLVLSVTPSSFSLPAGGSQVITVTADVSALPDDVWAFGEVMLSTDATFGNGDAVAMAHLPVSVVPTSAVLPEMVDITTRRNAGSQVVSDLRAGTITDLAVENFGLTQATLTPQMLSQDPTNTDPFDNLNDGTVFFITTTVPADAMRLVAQITVSESPDVDLYVGLDTGDGLPEASEVVCTSATGIALEYCNIDNPAPGMYWILVQDWEASADPPDLVILASAVVPGTDSGNMTVEGPSSVPSGQPFDITVYWDTPQMMAGDRWYGAFSLGTDPGTPGNLGVVPVDIDREMDDVAKTVDNPTPMAGDTLTYTITVQPNLTPSDLTYMLTDTIPAGLTYVSGTITSTSGTAAVMSDTLTWNGVLAIAGPGLVEGDMGGYFSLASLGVPPFALPSNADDGGWLLSGLDFFYLGQHYDTVIWSINGTLEAGSASGLAASGLNVELPDPALPNNLMAPWWTDLNLTSAGHWYAASLTDLVNFYTVFEWEDAPLYSDPSSTATFQIWIQDGTDSIWFTYGGFVGDTSTATVGIENDTGDMGSSYYYNGAGTLPSSANDLLVGTIPAAGATISYQATVDMGTVGQTLTNDVLHDTDNPGSMEASTSAEVTVLGYGVALAAPTDAMSGNVGDTVTYTLQLTNTGNLTDTVDLTYSGNEWMVMLPMTTTVLGPGESMAFPVSVTIPTGAMGGDSDMVTIMATSEGDATQMASVDLTTTAILWKFYLPLVENKWTSP